MLGVLSAFYVDHRFPTLNVRISKYGTRLTNPLPTLTTCFGSGRQMKSTLKFECFKMATFAVQERRTSHMYNSGKKAF